MSKLAWSTSRTVTAGGYQIPCTENLHVQLEGQEAGWNQVSGIRTDPPLKRIAKTMLWPAHEVRNSLLGNAYCHRGVGRWIRQAADRHTTFLEIGCGPLSLRKYLPRGVWYNGLDIAFSDFQLRRALRKPNVNLVMASADNIPLADNSVSLIGSCEAFMHFPDFDKAAAEMHRIARPGAKLACSIANTTCHKYRVRGVNGDFRQSWTFDGFAGVMARHGFKLLEGRMVGKWLPLPLWAARNPVQLPLSSPDEFYNSNFLYLFEAQN